MDAADTTVAVATDVRRRAEPQQRRSVERFERALAEAEEMVARRSFGELTMTDLAAQAGLSIGALYRWFPDRDALGVALAERVGTRLIEQAGRPALVASNDVTTVPVEQWLRRVRELLSADRAATSLLAQPTERDGPGAVMHRLLRDILAAALYRTTVAQPHVDHEVAATTLAILVRGLLLEICFGDPREGDRVMNGLIFAVDAYMSVWATPVSDP